MPATVADDPDTAPDGSPDVLHLVRCATLIFLATPAKQLPAKVGAFGCLLGLFATPAEAAEVLGLSRTTISRALQRLRRELAGAHRETQ